MKIKVLYVLSSVEKSMAFEWIAERLDPSKYTVGFILLGAKQTSLSLFLKARQIPVWEIPFFGKHQLLSAFFRLLRIFIAEKPVVVHVHLFEAGRIAIPVAWLLNIKKRIYTRHHSTYHHDYFPRAVIYDRMINRLSTRIVSISSVVTDVLVQKEQVDPEKISVIHHGFELEYFKTVETEKLATVKKYGIKGGPVIGVVSRYDRYKGVEYIIEAVAGLREMYKDIHLVLANARGERKGLIQGMLRQHLGPGSYTEIEFEENARALYSMFDIFVHVPIDPTSEAFGQVYIEALAMRIPCIFTISGIAHDLVKDGYNAIVVDYKSAASISRALNTLLDDKELRERLKRNGFDSIKKFDLEGMIRQLEALYR